MKSALILALSLCLLLPLYADAEHDTLLEIKSQYAGKRWQADIESVRGETVHVDIELSFPDAENMEILEAVYHKAVDNIQTDRIDVTGYPVAGEEYFFTDTGWFSIGWPDHDTEKRKAQEAKKAGETYNPDAETLVTTLSFGTFDLGTAYAMNNPYTPHDGWTLVQDHAERFFPGEDIQMMPHWVRATSEAGKYKRNKKLSDGYEKTRDFPDYRGTLWMQFDQVIHGIPLVAPVPYRDGTSYSGFLVLYPEFPSLTTYHMHFVLLTVHRVLEEHVRLCDPDLVIRSAEQMIREGRLRKVYTMRLGYAARKEDGDTFRLIPVWALEGELFESAKAEYKLDPVAHRCRPLEDTTLLFDACSGAWIDGVEQFPFN